MKAQFWNDVFRNGRKGSVSASLHARVKQFHLGQKLGIFSLPQHYLDIDNLSVAI